MNNNINKKNISIIIIIFIIIAVVIIGTYALSVWSSSQNTELTMRIGDVDGSVCQTGPNIEVSNVGPIFDYEKDGESTYFSIANFSSETLPVNITLYITSISDNLKTNDFKYVVMTSPDKKTYTKTSEGNFSEATNNSSIQLINNYQLSGNSTMNFKIIIYIDGNMENSTSLQGGTLNAGLSACSTLGLDTTSALATLTELGLEEYINDTELTIFSSTSAQDGTNGIYKSEDDLGDSYYFRGNVDYNYVKFGKNSSNQDMYWRIIRINGDGSIRMIYDGTQAHNNGVASEDRQVGISAFYNNVITSECYEDEEEAIPYTCVDNGLIGYMNGRTNGTNFPNGGTTSTSYDEAHANITNSTIKTYLENWYETNIVDRYYDQYVTDAIYCNNRKVATNQEIIDWFANENDIHYSTMGYGKSQTLYGIYDVVDADMFWGENGSITPVLKCPQENDKFSKNTNIGNGKLSYPVGLITIEETVFAGGNFEPNESFYLYTGNSFWTLSPDSCGEDGSGEGGITCSVRVIEEEGRAVYGAAGYSSSSGVRPVISLKSGVIVHGDGTKGNPFVVDGDV